MAGYHSAAEQWSLSTLDGSTVDFCSWFLDVKSLRESRDQNEFKHPEINLGYFYFFQLQWKKMSHPFFVVVLPTIKPRET